MSESKPTLHREQIAGMNIHYIMCSSVWALSPLSCGVRSRM